MTPANLSPSTCKRVSAAIIASFVGSAPSIGSAADMVALRSALAQLESGVANQGPTVLDVKVNGQPRGQAWVIVDRSDGVLVDESALLRWRVRVQDMRVSETEGRRYVAVGAIPGASASIDSKKQELSLTFEPESLESSERSLGADASLRPTVAPWAMFGNYALFGYRDSERSYGSGLVEAGLSGPYGVGLASFAANTAGVEGTTHRLVRLDTSWRYDDPDAMNTYILGDSYTLPSSWGRAVRFAGLQIARNYSLQPNLVTYPLQAFSGTAVVPSTVDVLVNGSRVGSQHVDAGPFTLTNVPVVTGSGEVQLIVRDAFGQQQVLTQRFYSSPRLLRAGLDEYSGSLGAMRQNYGLESSDYSGSIASGYWRHGATDLLTVEGRGDASSYVRNAGLSVDAGLGQWGTASLGVAGSTGRIGEGFAWLAGYEYYTPTYNFFVRTAQASEKFRQVTDEVLPPLDRQLFAGGGVNLGRGGSIGAAYISQRYFGQSTTETVTASYSVNVGQKAFLLLSASRTISPLTQTSLFASLMVPLDQQTTASVDTQAARANSRSSSASGATLQRTAPLDTGWGYRARVMTDDRYEGGVSYAGPYGNYAIEAAHSGNTTATRALVSGGLGYVGGAAFASKTVTESFGVVQVGTIAGVPVYHEGNLVAHTDENGRVVLPRLYAYMPNRVGIDDKDLPLDAAITSREQRVIPYYRSGVVVDFDVRRTKSALIEVRLPDGKAIPAGAQASSAGRSYLVGRNGELYVDELRENETFVVRIPGGTCSFTFPGPIPAEVLPKLGPFVCR